MAFCRYERVRIPSDSHDLFAFYEKVSELYDVTFVGVRVILVFWE